MKVLRIYNHLGDLIYEWNVYVEGADWSEVFSVPTPVWLGTIKLEELESKAEAEPTLEAKLEEFFEKLPEEEVIIEPKKRSKKSARVKRAATPDTTEKP